jgi:glycine oxidase
MSTADVVIAGGGIIGAACARAAARRGLRVMVCEPGPLPGAASPASAGMLAAQIEPSDEHLFPLAIRGRDLYEDLAAALKDTTGLDVGFLHTGIATVAFDDERAAALFEQVAAQRQAGLRCDWLEAAEFHERWPGAAPAARGALFAPEDGSLDPAALAAALLADAHRLGVQVLPESGRRVAVASGRVTGIVTNRAAVPAEHVVIAAGAWSPKIEALPRPLPVAPVRGQLVATAWPSELPPVILYHGHGYLLPRGREAILGSTMEHAGFDATTTASGIAHIRDVAEQLCPAIASAPTTRAWAGLRPVTPDGRPILGADPDVTGLWYATGHGRNGILLAGITGEIIGDLLATGQTDMDIGALSVARFLTGAADG